MGIMKTVHRNREHVMEVLYSKHLCCYPVENEAAKLFAEWMKNHPEYGIDDVDMKINSVEREEDYYGNGGGVDNTMIIYKTHEETDEEYKNRIEQEENSTLEFFMRRIHFDVSELIGSFDIYPNMQSDAISAHEKEIEDAIREVAINKIKNKH